MLSDECVQQKLTRLLQATEGEDYAQLLQAVCELEVLVGLGFGRIAVSQTGAPNVYVNLV